MLQDQVSDLDLDVLGLVTDWHLEAAKLKPKMKIAGTVSPRLVSECGVGVHPEGGANDAGATTQKSLRTYFFQQVLSVELQRLVDEL